MSTNSRPMPRRPRGNLCRATRNRSRNRRPAPSLPATIRSESQGHQWLAEPRDARAMLPPPRNGTTALAPAPRRAWGEGHMKSRLPARVSSTIVDNDSNRSVLLYREMRIGIVLCTTNITPYYFQPSRGTRMAQYAHPEVLVDTSFVKGILGDQK